MPGTNALAYFASSFKSDEERKFNNIGYRRSSKLDITQSSRLAR
jgi:hypothetical protein